MHTRRTLFPLLAAGLMCAAILASCSGGKIGYGVVLWSADKSPVKTGQVVTVKSQSKINNTYAVEIAGSKSSIEVPTWRIKLFPSQTEAVNFSATYSPMIPLFAKATTNGAPIRDKPDATATRLYRLRRGQVIKVISEQPKKVTIDGIDGHWYQVLTNDGVMGYSFDANLQVYNPSNQPNQQANVGQLMLDNVLATVYRPQYFQQMIDNNRIDLKKFSPKYGFFADPKKKTVRIVTPEDNVTFNYTDVSTLGPNDYSFGGTSLEMVVSSPDQIRLLYSDAKGNQYDQTFVKISQDIGYLVEKEKNRRLQVYSSFLDKTPFSSDYYGKIDLGADMSFTWTGYKRLVPDIIPSGAGATGVVDFPLYLSDSLRGQYDGVITFIFGAKPSQQSSMAIASIPSPVLGGSASTGSAGPTSSGSGASTAGGAGSGQGTSGTVAGGTDASGTTASSGAGANLSATGDTANHPTASFLYSFADGGVKLTYVPKSTVSGDTVASVSSTPIIIFFSFQASKG